MLFKDRYEAGRRLARELADLSGTDAVVLALPRGGVPVGSEVARALGAELDVIVVRKLGVPGHRELAMGAIASGGTRVLNDRVIEALGIPEEMIEAVTEDETRELARRERSYRGDRPPASVAGRTVILVDDGLATGATMRAAAHALRLRNPATLVAAVPVGAPDSCRALAEDVDRMVCLESPEDFYGVGLWYSDFRQTSDDEVRRLLSRQEEERSHARL